MSLTEKKLPIVNDTKAWFEEYKNPKYMEYFNIWLEEMGYRLNGGEKEGSLFGLREFCDSFYEVYRAFLEEYKPKLSEESEDESQQPFFCLGTKNIVTKCMKRDNCSALEIRCEMSPFKGYKADLGTLTINKMDDIFTAKFERDIKPDFSSQTTNFEHDPKFILNYLDFFIKHSPLFNLIFWLYTNNYTICTGKSCQIGFSFDTNGSYIDGLEGIIICVASLDYSENIPGFRVEIYIDLNSRNIVYDKCSIKLNEFPFPVSDNNIYDKVLNYIRVSRDKLAKGRMSSEGEDVSFEQVYTNFENYRNAKGKGEQKKLAGIG